MITMKAIDLFQGVDGDFYVLVQRGITLAAVLEAYILEEAEGVHVLEQMEQRGIAYFGGGIRPHYAIRWMK